MSATVTAKGQITIPKGVRDQLGLKPGSKLDFRINDAGEVVLVRTGVSTGGRYDRFMGIAPAKMSTDQILALTRGSD